MNPVHVHLILNHLPLLGAFAGIGLLVWGSLRRSDEVVRAALLAFIFSGLAAVPTYFSGEAAEELVASALGVPESFIEQHEQAAERAMSLVAALAVLATLMLRRYRAPARIDSGAALLCLLLALGTAASLSRAAYLGGRLRHPEIQADWKDLR